jgi:hypothetical protein
MHHETQLTFDWTRAERVAWIDEADLPPGHSAGGDSVAPATMKALLHKINDRMGANEWAWPSQESLAADLARTTKTIQRATEALVAMSLLIVQLRRNPSGRVTNHYRIVWTELQMLEPSRRARWRDMLRERVTTRHRPHQTPTKTTEATDHAPLGAGRSTGMDAYPTQTHRPPLGGPPLGGHVYASNVTTRHGERELRGTRHGCIQINARPSDIRAESPDMRSDIVSDRSDIVSDRSDIVSGRTLRELKPRTQETPPPRFLTMATLETSERLWNEVEGVLGELGVIRCAEAVRIFRQRGCSIEDARDLVSYYRERLGGEHGWQQPSYALWLRFTQSRPGATARDGWLGARPIEQAVAKTKSAVERTREMLSRVHVPPEQRASGFTAEERAAIARLGRA